MSMRSIKTQEAYDLDKANGLLNDLLDEPRLKDWKHWCLIKNRYPHDLHHTVNDILVLKKPADSPFEITADEYLEFSKIYKELRGSYDYIKLNLPSMISVPKYVHYHMLVLKKEYK